MISNQWLVFGVQNDIPSRILLKAEGGVFVEEEDEPNGEEDESENQEKGESGMFEDRGVFHAAPKNNGNEPEDAG